MLRNQVLIVGAPKSGKLTIIKETFGTLPEIISDDTHSGLTHEISLTTKYYTTEVGVMIDEFQDRTETNTPQAKGLTAWCTTLRDEECRELRDVLSGVVFTFNLSDSVDQIDHYGSQLSQLFETFDEDTFAADPESFGWGGIKLAVGFHRDDDPMVSDATLVSLEDIFIENGVEFVVYRETGSVSDEEGNKVGKHRIKEIFESHEWSGIDIEDKTPRERKTEDVCRSLLTDEELNLNEIISKIAKARLDTSELQTDEEKEAHAQKMVNSIMEYLG